MKDFIKRVIGLPGDHVQMVRGHLFVNGQEVPKVPVADYVETDRYGIVRHVPRYRETLPGADGKPGKSYMCSIRWRTARPTIRAMSSCRPEASS